MNGSVHPSFALAELEKASGVPVHLAVSSAALAVLIELIDFCNFFLKVLLTNGDNIGSVVLDQEIAATLLLLLGSTGQLFHL